MLLTITTTHKPATDLGFLLQKNPFRCQNFDLPFGHVNVFYPQATEEKCTAAILLDVDPIEMVRGKKGIGGSSLMDQYVNDRPYVMSSFLSVVISRIFATALKGECKQRPELIKAEIPLTAKIAVLPCRGGEQFLHDLFKPLGYNVTAKQHLLDETFPQWGNSVYYTLELQKTTTVSELLNHLYVLVPVMDNFKHYYIDSLEVEKLLAHGKGWLATHPKKEIITRRYLKHQISLEREALARLIDENPIEEEIQPEIALPEVEIEKTLKLNDERIGAVIAALRASGAKTVLDLGCGEGKLLRILLKEKQFTKIVGMDVSIRSLEIASEKLKLGNLASHIRERVELIHGSLMYKDKRLKGYDAACVIEVIEHLDPPRFAAFERVLFEFAHPQTVILTTPNKEYNIMWENIGTEKLRHSDHRFEWRRKEFQIWAKTISDKFGYDLRFLSVGAEAENIGAPTQMAIFTRVCSLY